MTVAVGSSGRDNTFDDETKKSALRGRFFFFALADFRCKVFDRLGACFLATLAPFPRACQHCARVCGASRFDAPYVRSFCLLVAELLPPLRQEGGQGLIAERTPADAAGSKMRRHFDRRWWANIMESPPLLPLGRESFGADIPVSHTGRIFTQTLSEPLVTAARATALQRDLRPASLN